MPPSAELTPPSPTPDPAWLEDQDGQRWFIQGSCSIGRSASNEIALSDTRVSRRHAAIQAQGEEFWIVDFGSRNGTYLKGHRISQPTRLHHHDLIRVGGSEWTFHHQSSLLATASSTILGAQTVVEINTTDCWLLVADLVSSTQLVRDLPADELPLVTGQWLDECKQTIETAHGRINQFLGDGFFAFWRDRAGIESAVSQTLQALRHLQDHSPSPFRLVLHHGATVIGGAALGEEERLSGVEVHFTFRMEKLAALLNCPRLLSYSACQRLGSLTNPREIGTHPLPGFDGSFKFFEF